MHDTVTVRLIHPYQTDSSLSVTLSRATPLTALTPILYEKGFAQPQKGGFRFLVRGHLCTDTRPIGDYMPDDADTVEIQVYAYAQIMV